MTIGILNRFAKSLHSSFQPSSPDEYVALRLAHHLGEPEAAGHYALLASQYSQATLLCCYRRAIDDKSGKLATRIFHDHLSAIGTNERHGIAHPRLVSARIERRAVAVAVFSGIHLEGRRVLQLSSDPKRAAESAAAFIREVLYENNCSSAAIESVPGDVRRAVLHSAIIRECRALGVSVWEISKLTVFKALAHPSLKTRGDVRELMLRMWPMAALKRSQVCALDAFALGLYVQTERLFAADQ
jgi:hypothetical protein